MQLVTIRDSVALTDATFRHNAFDSNCNDQQSGAFWLYSFTNEWRPQLTITRLIAEHNIGTHLRFNRPLT